eukprot:m.100530 g.100530  ORF g.100530 m.100530 type:complete len:312 (-) comp9046_c4_seq1:180-1115(-)
MSVDCAVNSHVEVEVLKEKLAQCDEPSLSSNFIIHTGNVRRCNHLQAVVNPTTQQEIVTALKCTMNCWNKYNKSDVVLQTEIIPHPKLMAPHEEVGNGHERMLKVKVLVLEKYEPGLIHTAVTGVLKAVKFGKVDKLVFELKSDGTTTDDVLQAWKDEEELKKEGFASELGVAGLSTKQLETVLEKADVPVSFHEVSDEGLCCDDEHPHRKLSSYHGVTLVHNDDDGDVLPKQTFQKVMTKVLRHEPTFTPAGEMSSVATTSHGSSSTSSNGDAKLRVEWTPVWVARYTIIDTKTSVIDKTGYAIGGRYKL